MRIIKVSVDNGSTWTVQVVENIEYFYGYPGDGFRRHDPVRSLRQLFGHIVSGPKITLDMIFKNFKIVGQGIEATVRIDDDKGNFRSDGRYTYDSNGPGLPFKDDEDDVQPDVQLDHTTK